MSKVYKIYYFKEKKDYAYFLKKYLHKPYEWVSKDPFEKSLKFFEKYENFCVFIYTDNNITFGSLEFAKIEFKINIISTYKAPKLQIE